VARFLDVRRTAALDMALHGSRLIVAEFAIGTAVCAGLGVLAIASGIRSLAHGISFALVLGLLLIGAALNYLPLLIHSIDISRKDSSKEEAKEELARPELIRRYSARQFVLLVPFAVAVMAVLQSRRLG
jgi:hypothetical protein